MLYKLSSAIHICFNNRIMHVIVIYKSYLVQVNIYDKGSSVLLFILECKFVLRFVRL